MSHTSSNLIRVNDSSIRVLHCADLHLDAVLGDSVGAGQFAQLSSAEQMLLRDAPILALEKIINISDLENIDIVVIAGDVFNRRDGVSSDIRTRSAFTNFLRELNERSIQVFITLGNHDPLNSIADLSAPWPDSVHLFSSRAPLTHTFEIKNTKVAVHGVSYENNEESRDLASMFPGRIEDSINIGVLHTNVGSNSIHSNYAPANLDTLRSKNYDYFALGHIHLREVLSEHPHIAYSGNTQALSSKPSESEPKGCIVSELSLGEGVLGSEFKSTDSVRYLKLEIDIPESYPVEDIPTFICNEIQRSAQNSSITYLVRTSINYSDSSQILQSTQLRDLVNEQRGNFVVTKIKLKVKSLENEILGNHPFFEIATENIEEMKIPSLEEIYGKKADLISSYLKDEPLDEQQFKEEVKNLVFQTYAQSRPEK